MPMMTGTAGAGSGGAPMMSAISGGSGGRMAVSGSGGASSMPAMSGTGGNTGAGSGGMTGGAGTMADAGIDAGASGDSDADGCGEGGMVGKASNDGAGAGRGNGNTQFTLSAGNQILRMVTTLEVPVKPTGNTTLFLWPGLEPLQGMNYSPIGTGVLQPVLTWGGSCAPGSPQTRMGGNWWISAQYVNTLGSEPDHSGCYGGSPMDVEIGDQLLIDMSLKGTVWNQTVTSQKSGDSVDFDMDMNGQPQRWALFEIEMPTSTKPASDVVFTNTVITFEKPEPEACQPNTRGANDYFSAPVTSADGLRCCVARLVLRASGVAATTMDPPP
jgi:hypothetical protein